MTITDEMVERAAKAHCPEAFELDEHGNYTMLPSGRREARDEARTTLLAALGETHVVVPREPVAFRYDWRLRMFTTNGDDSDWVTTVGFKKPKDDHRNEYRNIVSLYAAPTSVTSPDGGRS